MAGSLVKKDRFFPSMSGQFASDSNWQVLWRDLALFNMAVDSKLRGCDLVRLKVADVYAAGAVKERTSILQSKTRSPVRFEITDGTRKSLADWIAHPHMIGHEYLWPGRFHDRPHISTRQYARLLKDWVRSIGLEPSAYGTHSMRRTKSRPNLQEDWQPSGSAIAPRPYEDGQHRPLSRCGLGRRTHDFGKCRNLTILLGRPCCRPQAAD